MSTATGFGIIELVSAILPMVMVMVLPINFKSVVFATGAALGNVLRHRPGPSMQCLSITTAHRSSAKSINFPYDLELPFPSDSIPHVL